jgi:hypothetical protein
MITLIDKLLIVGVCFGSLLAIGCGIAAIYYDPEIEIYPGRTMARSFLKEIDYWGEVGSDGQWHEWSPPR